MSVSARYYTDPACPWSWSAEPAVRKLMVEFGGNVSWTYVMGGLARDYTRTPGGQEAMLAHWLDIADAGGMPIEPRLWRDAAISSSYPACIAVKAAADQAADGGYRYLRVVREGLMCFRRKLDTTEALVEEARRAGLDVERFRVDVASNATLEAFGNDLEEVRDPPEGAVLASSGRISFPSVLFIGENGSRHGAWEFRSYADLRAAAEAAGAEPVEERPPGVLDALRRFGTMATAEVAAVCELPGPRAAAELWRLATEWQVRPVRVITGELWELP
jgi:protein-disulfide isomerase-like protein with CxxC motif